MKSVKDAITKTVQAREELEFLKDACSASTNKFKEKIQNSDISKTISIGNKLHRLVTSCFEIF